MRRLRLYRVVYALNLLGPARICRIGKYVKGWWVSGGLRCECRVICQGVRRWKWLCCAFGGGCVASWVAMPNVDVAYDEDMALCGLLFKNMLGSALGFLTALPFSNLLYTFTGTTS